MDRVLVFDDAAGLAEGGARFVLEQARRAVAERGRFALALAGGGTPRALYEVLAGAAFREPFPWGATELFFGDERAVPPEHRESNYRMAQDSLLARAPIAATRVHRMPAEQPDLAAAARAYEQELRRVLTPDDLERGAPRLDLALLGIGEDGHTASLFPGQEALAGGPELVIAVEKPGGGRRLTLTYRALNAARAVAFLVAGAAKREVLRRVLAPVPGEPPLPAARVRPQSGARHFLADRAARP